MERLELPYPVAARPRPRPCGGCTATAAGPGRYLFDRRSLLRFLHYGEGEYLETELAIQECLREMDPDLELPAPLEPLRPEDAPGVLLEPQTADIVLPADRERLELVRDWTDGRGLARGRRRRRRGELQLQRGRAFAVLSGDDVEPGLYETDGTVTAEAPGLRLHARAVHARAASAFLISRGSMKRTSSLTTSNSDTSSVPRARKKSTSR